MLLVTKLSCSTAKNLQISNAVSTLLNQEQHGAITNVYIESSHGYNEVLTHLLKGLEQNFSIYIGYGYEDDRIKHSGNDTKGSYVLILAGDFENLKNFVQHASSESWFFNSFYIIVLREVASLQKVFAMFWKLMVANVDVLVDDGSSNNLTLFTFFPFSRQSCNDTRPEMINEFRSAWSTAEFFPKKFRNLHSCPLNVMTYEVKPAMMIEKLSEGSYKLHGFEGDLFTEVAAFLNFSMNLLITTENVGTGLLYSNGETIRDICNYLKSRKLLEVPTKSLLL